MGSSQIMCVTVQIIHVYIHHSLDNRRIGPLIKPQNFPISEALFSAGFSCGSTTDTGKTTKLSVEIFQKNIGCFFKPKSLLQNCDGHSGNYCSLQAQGPAQLTSTMH